MSQVYLLSEVICALFVHILDFRHAVSIISSRHRRRRG